MKYLFLEHAVWLHYLLPAKTKMSQKLFSDKPGTSGDYRIIIEGEETDAQTSRSSRNNPVCGRNCERSRTL